MAGEQIFWLFAWFFFLICGGLMIFGVYLIVRKKPEQKDIEIDKKKTPAPTSDLIGDQLRKLEPQKE